MSADRKSSKFGFRISSIFNQPHSPSSTNPTKRTNPLVHHPGSPQKTISKPVLNKNKPSSRPDPPQALRSSSSSGADPNGTAPDKPIARRTEYIPTQRYDSPQLINRDNGTNGISSPPMSPNSQLRRKKPPPEEEPEEMLYFNTPNIVKTSPSPATPQMTTNNLADRIVDSENSSVDTSTKSGSSNIFGHSPIKNSSSKDSGVNYEVMTNLEQDIDHFLTVNDSPKDNGFDPALNDRIANIQYDDSSSGTSSTKPLPNSEQEDYPMDYGSHQIQPMNPKGSKMPSPYPIDYSVENSNVQLPLGTGSPSNTPLEIIEMFQGSDKSTSDLANISSSRSSTPEQLPLKLPSVVTPKTPQRGVAMAKSWSDSARIKSPSTSSSQYTNLSQIQPQRTMVSSEASMNFPIQKSNTINTMGSTFGSQRSTHRRQSSSISSIMSSNSYRNVNLAALKKTLNLKPGEGERSNYVWAIRRSAGTAFNENGPSRWKLPVGILPVDRTALYENSNGKYLRLAGGVASRKKTSGVELKHGHLKPRLLAAEIDEDDDNGLQLTSNTPPISTHSATTSRSGGNKSSDSNKVSRQNSLARTVTDASMGASSDLQSDIGSSINQDKRDSVSTSSSDSIDKLAFVTGFYQHRSYKRGDEDKQENGSGETDIEGNTMSDYNHQSYSDLTDMDGYEERPRLYLANPDNDSDSD